MSRDLILMPEVEARLALRHKPLRERVLAPPFAALGVGRLRVLRVREEEEAVVLLCGYEGYERL